MPKQIFSTQRYLQKRSEVIQPKNQAKGRREWIVSRGLCHYRLFSLTDIPLARREKALQLQIQQWSPFREYASYSVWEKSGQVQVWIWDKQLQQEQVAESGQKKITVLPETVLHSFPTTNTLQLIQCIEGVEGQIWQEGILVGSRWWANSPHQKEWAQFQRTHGLPANPNLPPLLESSLLERPWGRTKRSFNKFVFLYQESTWVTLGAAIFTMLFSWQVASFFKWQQALTQTQTQIDQLNESVGPVLTARTQALADKQRFKQLLLLNPYPSQLELITTIAQEISPKKVFMVNWSYQMGQLTFIIKSAYKLDPTYYIKTLQAKPFFKEVKAEARGGPKRLFISTKVEPMILKEQEKQKKKGSAR
jgi:hypothetical protein